MTLNYKNEKPLFLISMLISLIFWLAVGVLTYGGILIWVVLLFIFYLFVQSGFIAFIKGTAVKITESQYPEIYQMHIDCCNKLDIKTPPEIYLLNGDGILNALATRFLGRNFVVLFTDVVDALQRQPEALRFYIGHELGHIKQKHLQWGPVLFPASILPILGAAYSRGQESTCDLHGLACCEKLQHALAGVAVLAAGDEVWTKLNVNKYADQSAVSGKFWMSFHELISDYPWLVKRMARIISSAKSEKPKLPRRNPLAYLFALFVPRLGIGGGGGLIGVMIIVAIIGILASIAIPAYQSYIVRAQVIQSYDLSESAQIAVEQYILEHKQLPADLNTAGFVMPENQLMSSIKMNSEGTIIVEFMGQPIQGETLELRPYLDEQKHIQWDCSGGSLSVSYRPRECGGSGP